jgi:hypothetical protein
MVTCKYRIHTWRDKDLLQDSGLHIGFASHLFFTYPALSDWRYMYKQSEKRKLLKEAFSVPHEGHDKISLVII